MYTVILCDMEENTFCIPVAGNLATAIEQARAQANERGGVPIGMRYCGTYATLDEASARVRTVEPWDGIGVAMCKGV